MPSVSEVPVLMNGGSLAGRRFRQVAGSGPGLGSYAEHRTILPDGL
jgi:hypothetical protein